VTVAGDLEVTGSSIFNSTVDLNSTVDFTDATVVGLPVGDITLAANVSAGATSITVSRVPSNMVAGVAYMVIDPFSTNAELRKISSISGTTITPSVGKSAAFTRLQFTNQTIQLRREIAGISGDGATVTVNTKGPHLLSSSDAVRIDGTTNFNITSVVVTVTDGDTFTYSSAVNTNDGATGYSIHTSDIDDLAAYFKRQTIVISGSAANNGVFTITNVINGTNLTSAIDGCAIQVAEALTSEASGNSTTLTINLNKSHPAGTPVWFLATQPINVQWYGAIPGSTAHAARNAAAFGRAVGDGYYQGVPHIYVPSLLPGPTTAARYYVDEGGDIEREMLIEGDGPKISVISANGMTFPDWGTAVIRGRRDGRPQAGSHGGYSARHSVKNIGIEGGEIPGANGGVFSIQQPMKFEMVDFVDCPGWGLVLVDCQQGTFEDLRFKNCGTSNSTVNLESGAMYARSIAFVRFGNSFNVEETGHKATAVRLLSGSSSFEEVTFENSHIEVTPTEQPAYFFHCTGDIYNLKFDGGRFAGGPGITNWFFDFGSQGEGACVYTIANCHSGGADTTADAIAIHDVERNFSYPWNTTASPFQSFISLFVAANHDLASDSGNTNATYAIWAPGLNGRLLKLGAPNGGSANAPNIFSRLGGSSEVHAKLFNQSSNLTFGIYNGAVSNFGTHYVQGAVQQDTNVLVGGTNVVNWQRMPNVTASRALVLDSANRVTVPSGTPDGTKFLRDDNTYAVPSGSLPSLSTTPGALLGSDGSAITYFTYANSIREFDEFLGDTAQGKLGWTENANGGSIGQSAMINTNHFGVRQIGTGSSATASPCKFLHFNSFGFGGGALIGTWGFRLEDLSDDTEDYNAWVGWNDATNGLGTDAAILHYNDNVNSGAFEFITRSANGTPSTNLTSATVAADTDYRVDIVGNAAATEVVAYLNGTAIATNVSAIPNIRSSIARSFGPVFNQVKTLGTTARLLQADYFGVVWLPTTSR